MLIPSGIQPPDDRRVETKKVGPGLYVATNAYVGKYDYFRERSSESEARVSSGTQGEPYEGEP